MTLDTRAAHAARALRESVAEATPVPVGVVVRRQRVSLASAVVGAAAVAALTIAFAAAIPKSVEDVTPDVADTNRIVPTEITDPVKPEPEPEGSPIGVVDKGYPAPPTEGVAQYNTTSTEFHAYTKFYGSGPVGAVVQATSDYGSASTVVGLTGEFVLKVSFTDAPYNVEFPVVVTMAGESFTFGFTSLWDPANTPITAYRSIGSSTSASPYDVYYGTAPPGTAVSASSAYGSGSTTANEKGEWSLKVWFSGMPSGQSFTVTLNVGGTTFPFGFTWTQPPAPTSVSVLWMHKDEGQGQWMKFGLSGPAGTVVQATSPYGSASITLQGKPEEHLKVFFSGAPLGEPFQVTLKVNGATFGSPYAFTSNWDPANTPITWNVHYDNTSGSPWIKFTGTAPPGTKVEAFSAYGSDTKFADANGWYQVKIFFDAGSLPVGEPFPVELCFDDVTMHTHQFTYNPS